MSGDPLSYPTDDHASKEQERVIVLAEGRKEFVQVESGDWAWWPSGEHGYLTAHQLRWIADELDRRNES